MIQHIMRGYTYTAVAALATMAGAASLSDLCTVSNVQAALPSNGTLLGIDVIPSSATATVTTLSSGTMGGPMKRATSNSTSTQYCNVTVTYTHPGKSDSVYVVYAFPSPSAFENRFYVAGGGGYSLASTATGGITYGAAGGATDAGYAGTSFSSDLMATVLAGNGSINWDNVYMFSYQALGEMTVLGKYLTTGFYGLDSDTKIYTYYEGCSDGGREGMSQVQRYGAEYDGAVVGAPALRFAQQQVLHVFPATVEQIQGYYPPPCALEKIVTAIITACDPLDGRTDGVISRTDLCKLNFNLSSLIGQSYSCAASSGSSSGGGGPPGMSGGSSTPAQNGTLTAKDIAVASTIYGGLFNSAGQRAYLSWQIGSELSDASTTYDNSTGTWGLDIPSTGGEYVTKFIELLDLSNLSNLDGVTYDTLVQWMNIGMFRYYDSLQNTQPDLTTFKSAGGKLLHYHGESDPSIPSASSVHYWQSVLGAMYSNISHAAGVAAMKDWYQFYLIPGAAHCSTNTLQPGPYPENNMNIMIDWVENGVQPTRLNATVSSGTYKGETQMLCQWPTRPLWKSNSTFTCVHNTASYKSWTYDFDAFKVAVY